MPRILVIDAKRRKQFPSREVLVDLQVGLREMGDGVAQPFLMGDAATRHNFLILVIINLLRACLVSDPPSQLLYLVPGGISCACGDAHLEGNPRPIPLHSACVDCSVFTGSSS